MANSCQRKQQSGSNLDRKSSPLKTEESSYKFGIQPARNPSDRFQGHTIAERLVAYWYMIVVTRRDTFNHLLSWLEDVKQHGNEEIKTALIANKSDLAAKRQVSREEGEAFAKKNNLMYFESSAKTGENVEEAFLSVASAIYEHLRLERDPNTLSEQEIRRMEGHGVKVGPKRPANLLATPSPNVTGGNAAGAGQGGCCLVE
ncbi:hypothetical protein HDU76_000725 [Blyttiomyces sp. JEL0837]|nr:hypothetical protein HDU76_000725 [Blyttiomyces sp. JEL0837]